MNAVLSPAEIIEITGRQRYRAQALALARMGVPDWAIPLLDKVA